MIIPHRELSPDALQGLVEEFITREGTDYGEVEVPLADKVKQVISQLDKGQVVILFDSFTERCNIVTQEALRELQRKNS